MEPICCLLPYKLSAHCQQTQKEQLSVRPSAVPWPSPGLVTVMSTKELFIAVCGSSVWPAVALLPKKSCQLRVLQTVLPCSSWSLLAHYKRTRGASCCSCKLPPGPSAAEVYQSSPNKTLIICYYCSEIDLATMSGRPDKEKALRRVESSRALLQKVYKSTISEFNLISCSSPFPTAAVSIDLSPGKAIAHREPMFAFSQSD